MLIGRLEPADESPVQEEDHVELFIGIKIIEAIKNHTKYNSFSVLVLS